MAEEYKIESGRRTCEECGRQFAALEEYVSAVFESADDAKNPTGLARLDFCSEHWPANRAELLAFWRTRVPPPEEPKQRRYVISDERLMEVFLRLQGTDDPGRLDARYVIALMLVRKRRLKLESTRRRDGQSYMILRKSRSKETFEAVDRRLSDEAVLAVSAELGKLLEDVVAGSEEGSSDETN